MHKKQCSIQYTNNIYIAAIMELYIHWNMYWNYNGTLWK